VYKSKVELVEAIAKEKNANAFAVGVASVRIFMEKSSNAGQIALPVAEAMVKAGFKQAKAKIVEACRKVSRANIELVKIHQDRVVTTRLAHFFFGLFAILFCAFIFFTRISLTNSFCCSSFCSVIIFLRCKNTPDLRRVCGVYRRPGGRV
jgi:hypothetical protein